MNGFRGLPSVLGVALVCSLVSVPGERPEAHAAAVVPPYAVAYSTPTFMGADPAAIFALRADGSERLQLTRGDSLDLPKGWSPDGSRLLFERIDSTRAYSTIWTVGLDGAPPVQLGGSTYDELPVWSPDGSLIAWQEQSDFGSGGGRADTSFGLWVERPDRTALKLLGAGGTDGSSADWVGDGSGWDWSPDSRSIALVQPNPAHVDPASSEPEQLLAVLDVSSRHARVHVKLSDAFPDAWGGWAWSSDGRRIAFVRPGAATRIGVLDVTRRAVVGAAIVAARGVAYQGARLPLGEYGIGWIWITPTRLGVVQADRAKPQLLHLATVDAATGKVWQIPVTLSTRVIEKTSLVTQWTTSPNGKLIGLFAARPGSAIPSLVVADVARHTTRVVGPGTAANWSPDGGHIAVVVAASNRAACGTLRIISPRGAVATRIAKPAAACDGWPEWSDDGARLTFTRSQAGTDRVFTVGWNGYGLRALVPVPASEVTWPTGCGQIYWHQFAWLLPDSTGTLQLVRRPPLPTNSVEAWRCS